MSVLENKVIFAENLKYYMRLNNVDRNKLCNDLDFNHTTVREWTNGTAYPRIDKIEMFSNYFNIEKSDLIEKRNKEFDELELLFDKAKPHLSEDDKEIMKFLMQKTINNYENSKKLGGA